MCVCQYLKKFGLEPKSPELLNEGRILGFQVGKEDSKLVSGGLCLVGPVEVETKFDIFLLWGKLIGHSRRWLV